MPFYAVRSGFNTGIYLSWSECERQIKGFKGAKFQKFDTREEASNFVNGITVVNIPNQIQVTNISNNNDSFQIDPQTTIYGDGAYNPNTKPDAWGSVVNGYGIDLIGYFSDLLTDMTLKETILPRGIGRRIIIVANFSKVEHQNNGGELLAAVAALRIAFHLISIGIPVKTVFCDSQIILYWSIRLKSESAINFDPIKVVYINELIHLRKKLEVLGCNFSKISGGRNLADLGYHIN